MEQVELSQKTVLSRIIRGFWRLVEWNMTSEELARFMGQCIDLGVTTFDTAEIYSNGECERLIGEAFRKAPYLAMHKSDRTTRFALIILIQG